MSLDGSHRSLVTFVVHLASRALWPRYSHKLRPSERRQWCNKITCGLHVSMGCCGCVISGAAVWRSGAARTTMLLHSVGPAGGCAGVQPGLEPV
jgi:hypothetical protein